MNMNDMLGLGKVLPIDKLIDVLSKSVGRLSKSYFDRKDVDTKVYEVEKLAEARAKEMKIMTAAIRENFSLTGGIEYNKDGIAISSPKDVMAVSSSSGTLTPELATRTHERIDFQEQKKQLNIESITTFAVDELRNEEPVTDAPLDEDWTTRFFKIAEDISTEEMQALWGKILAGEIKRPESYSLRTLELLRNLSKEEAEIFRKVANFAIKSTSSNESFLFTDENVLQEKFNISYSERALLTEIGLLQSGTFVNYQLTQSSQDTEFPFIAGKTLLLVKIKAETPTVKIPVNMFSKSGSQLLELLPVTPPFDYLAEMVSSIKNNNVSVKYADILALEGDTIRHTLPFKDF